MTDETVVTAEPEKEPKRPAKKKAEPREAITVLEVVDTDGELTDEVLKKEIEEVLKRTAEDGVAFVSVPKHRATPELVIWLRDKMGCQTAPLNVNSNLHIKDHDARTRGGWVCHPTS